MQTVTRTLGELVDRTLEELRAPQEQGGGVLRSASLTASETTFTLATTEPAVNIGDILEFADEIMLVTDKTSDASPTYTVSRGYSGTVAVAHGASEQGEVNPAWPRYMVARAVMRAFPRMEAADVFLVKSESLSPSQWDDGLRFFYIEIPEDARRIIQVRDGLVDMFEWAYVDNVPFDTVGSGKLLRFLSYVATDDVFQVIYRATYRWDSYPDDPDSDSEIEIPEGCEYLPSCYAAAWMLSAREVERHSLDRVAEWVQGEPGRNGVSQGMVRAKWQEFYQNLDAAQRLQPQVVERPYLRRRRRVTVL